MRPGPIACITTLLVLAAAIEHAAGDAYPSKPIRVVVPYSAGSSIDVVARLVVERAGPVLGQQIVVDNRAGASGLIGSELVARAAPDGYTLLIGNVGPLTIGPGLYRKMPYDPLRDFAPVTQMSALPFVIFAGATLPANSVKELVALAKAQPGALNYGSGGVGSGLHLTAEMFSHLAGIKMVNIAFKDSNQMVPEIFAGRVQLAFYTIPSFLPHVKAGRMKVLAIASRTRFPLLPQVPTSAEAGMPGFISSSWHGLLAPAHAPPPVIRRLNQALVTVLAAPGLREQLVNQGAEIVASTPDEFAQFLREDLARWRNVIAVAGVKPE